MWSYGPDTYLAVGVTSMTVEVETNITTHLGNGVTVTFPFYFPVYEAEHLIVSLQNLATGTVTKVSPSLYTISGLNDPGGSITFLTGPVETGMRLIIERRVPYTQPLNLLNQSGYFPDTVEEQLDKTVMQIQQLKEGLDRTVQVPVPEDGFELPNEVDRAGKILGFDGDGKPIMYPESGTGAGGRIASFRAPSDAKSIGINGVALAPVVWPRSAVNELYDGFSGENQSNLLINQAPIELGQCSITPIHSYANFQTYSGTPILDIDGTPRRIMPVSIWTSLFNSPPAPPLFRPTKVNGYGFLTFEYIGQYPLHTTIVGDLDITMRVTGGSVDTSTIYTELKLRPFGPNQPPANLGGSGGAATLGVSTGALSVPKKFANAQSFYDFCGDPPDDYSSLITGGNLFTSNIAGYFTSTTPGDTQLTTDDLGPVGPEVQCTNWMNVSGIDKTLHSFLFDYTGTSRYSRVRYKDADDNVFYLGQQSSNSKARRIYRLPPDAVAVQIYYTGRGTTAYNGSPKFYRLTAEASSAYDPVKGLFIEKHISVNRDVVFWPGVEYCLELSNEAIGFGANVRDWSLRYDSGGLSFLFDAGAIRKEFATKLWEL